MAQVVVVGLAGGDGADLAVARRLAAGGAVIVVVGADADRAGTVLAAVEAGGGRVAYFKTAAPVPDDAELDALAELVAELDR